MAEESADIWYPLLRRTITVGGYVILLLKYCKFIPDLCGRLIITNLFNNSSQDKLLAAPSLRQRFIRAVVKIEDGASSFRRILSGTKPDLGRIRAENKRAADAIYRPFASAFLRNFNWEAGTRTPIARSRVWSPTIGRPPNAEKNLRMKALVVNHAGGRVRTVSQAA